MPSEERIREGFKKAKEDVEGVKNELAFALRRIAKIEEIMTKQAISGISMTEYNPTKKSSKKKK